MWLCGGHERWPGWKIVIAGDQLVGGLAHVEHQEYVLPFEVPDAALVARELAQARVKRRVRAGGRRAANDEAALARGLAQPVDRTPRHVEHVVAAQRDSRSRRASRALRLSSKTRAPPRRDGPADHFGRARSTRKRRRSEARGWNFAGWTSRCTGSDLRWPGRTWRVGVGSWESLQESRKKNVKDEQDKYECRKPKGSVCYHARVRLNA